MTEAARRPWLAGLTNFFFPGLGLLYAGAPRLVLPWLVASYAIALLAAAIALWLPIAPLNLVVPAVLIVGFPVTSWWLGWRVARRAARPFAPGRFNRGWIYLAFAIASGVLSNLFLDSLVRPHIVQAFRNPSGSMEPGLRVGDYVLAGMYDRGRASRGAPVIFESVEEPGLLVFKRVIAVGGDTVALVSDSLYLNGRLLSEPYTIHTGPAAAADTFTARVLSEVRKKYAPADTTRWTLATWGPIVVPGGEFFALGDNRDASYDSRFYGTVPVDHVRGTPRVIYFSADSAGVRWRRLGRRVK